MCEAFFQQSYFLNITEILQAEIDQTDSNSVNLNGYDEKNDFIHMCQKMFNKGILACRF